MNQSAVEALAKAMVEMERGFTKDAVAYALISIASSALDDDEASAAWQQYEKLLQKRTRVI